MGSLRCSKQVLDERERSFIDPLQIVDGEQQRPERRQCPVRGFEDAERVGRRLVVASEDEPFKLRTVARDLGQLAKQLAHRGKGDLLHRLEPGHPDVPGGICLRHGLEEQPRLAAAGLTGDERRSGCSVLPGAPHHGRQKVQLTLTADERGTHRS